MAPYRSSELHRISREDMCRPSLDRACADTRALVPRQRSFPRIETQQAWAAPPAIAQAIEVPHATPRVPLVGQKDSGLMGGGHEVKHFQITMYKNMGVSGRLAQAMKHLQHTCEDLSLGPQHSHRVIYLTPTDSYI